MKQPLLGLMLLCVLVPGSPAKAADFHQISTFNMPSDGIAFHNYSIWNKSKLPHFLQVAHCTGMALLARQVHNWAVFDSSKAPLTPLQYEQLLKRIYKIPTWLISGLDPSPYGSKVILPGYADLYGLTHAPGMEEVVKNVLGDALADALRPNWNWSPVDVFITSRKMRRKKELLLRSSVAHDQVALLYLTEGTKEAHAILLYGYEVRDDRVIYTAYDSNWPDQAIQLPFVFSNAKFEHPDFGWRDPWILHPYRAK